MDYFRTMGKSLLLLISYIFIIQPVIGQRDLQLMRLNNEDFPVLSHSEVFTESDSERYGDFLSHRYSLMGYRGLKLDDYQVISSHQSNSNFDIVYYIDNSGKTVRRFLTTTAPMNFDHIATSHFDSLNPYGSVGMASALINGLLGTILNRGLGLK